ncbi:MAG: nickel pincer cofactor biosynthesis protein LarB [Halolamina sp.]
MREVLETLAAGDCTVAEAEAALAGYATTGAGRFDAAREHRRGLPEGILAATKTPREVGELAVAAVETTGRALVTRADAEDVTAVEAALATDADDPDGRREVVVAEDGTEGSGPDGADYVLTYDERAGTLVAETAAFEPPSLSATVGLVSGGTADAAAVGEARTVCEAMGAATTTAEDVGVAHLGRVLDQLDDLRAADVLVVAAGREGALPTVVAGLVDTPVIGLPVSAGYGAGGDGEAALQGMLQSCTVLSVVNVDAGYVAGAQAGLVARAVNAARDS